MILPIADLLPHAPPMRLLDVVSRFEGAHVECSATLLESCPFADATGMVDPLVTVELVAQAAAAWAALTGGGGVRPGVVASCRDAHFEDVTLRVGDLVTIRAERTAGSADFGSFSGIVSRGQSRVATISLGVVLGGSS
jgi:predicted hotdog family 3-hydroxylacyl-ACP dehydratase